MTRENFVENFVPYLDPWKVKLIIKRIVMILLIYLLRKRIGFVRL